MIDYDYRLTIDMGTKKPTYVPDDEYKGPLKNIFRIEGPNMSGKSTLMNLIAISAFGLKNKSVNKVLQKHLDDMVHDKSTELTFCVNIVDPVSGRAIRATRNSPDADILIEDSDDGKNFSPISDDSFSRKYNLIYDIPDNPIDRLADISHEISVIHQNCSSKLNSFQSTVDHLIYDISNGPDEELLKQYRAEVEKYDKNNGKDVDCENKKKKYQNLAKLYYAIRIRDANKKADDLKRTYDFVKKEEEKKKTRPQDIKKSYDADIAAIKVAAIPLSSAQIAQLSCDVSALGNLSVSEAFEVISEFDIGEVIAKKSVPVKYFDAISKIEREISVEDIHEENSTINAMLDIINVLRKYKNENINIPDLGSLNNLLSKLERDYKVQSRSIGVVSSSKRILEKVGNIWTALIDIDGKVGKLKPPVKEDVDEQYYDKFRVESEERKWRNAKNELTTICSEASKFGVDLSNYATEQSKANAELGHVYDRAQVSDIFNAMSSEEKEYKSAIESEKKNTERIGAFRAYISKMENVEKSPYAEHINALNKISTSLMALKGIIDKDMKMLTQVEKKSYGPYDPEDPFFKSVWTYLGKRVGFVRYGQDTYPIRYVNTVDDIITATDGTILRLRQISTGLNQRNYLMSKLQTDDDRPIIALFDEVSTMTNKTQEDIFEKFVELQKQGKLMVGMMNMPSDEKKVTSFGQ